ncbi:MAG: hypothetical protein HQL12_06410 [Candidatus Omnitrophica bacterium]|nr:hypothetical protein [Candidatus Omnitrophota bacterium]
MTNSKVKANVAKNVLKNISFGAGVLYHKVSKAAQAVRPANWKVARKAVKTKIVKKTAPVKPEMN